MLIESLIAMVFIKNFYLCLRTINIVDIVVDGEVLCTGIGSMIVMLFALYLLIDLSIIILIYK